MRIYIVVTSPYPQDRDVTGWYQSLGSTSPVRPDGKLMVMKFATGMHESWLYTPTTSTELSIFLIILSLIPNPSYLSPVLVFRSLYTNLRYGYTREVVAGSE